MAEFSERPTTDAGKIVVYTHFVLFELYTCMCTITYFRLKQFFKRPSLRNVQFSDSELFQLHSPTVSEDESQPQLSKQIGGSNSIDDSIPPLPSPMPTLEQLCQSSEPKSNPLGHSVKKRKRVASFGSQTMV